jgi:hypothetical protein
MVTTYLNYNLITRDLGRSIERVASQALVAREAQYYRDNIGKVATVDDFLGDYRLYSYAMKAYGLDDMTYAVAFMRQVLESDLSDSESFANKLTDERYRNFASAFAFGDSASAVAADLQSDRQEEDLIGLYSQRMQDTGTAHAREYTYYQSHISQIANVQDFVADRRLAEFALKAVGVDTTYFSMETLRQVLTSDPDDPASVANSLGDSAFVELARLFNFSADGSLPTGVPAQNAAQIKSITESYIFDVPDRIVPLAAQLNREYFTEAITGVAHVDDLIGNPRMVAYIRTAYGLPITPTGLAEIRAALTSDLSSPDSFANSSENGAYRALATLFNFRPDGSLAEGDSAQTAEQTAALNNIYSNNYDATGNRRDTTRSDSFRASAQLITSVDEFMRNRQVYDYALIAFGFDPATESRDRIRRALTSDLSDPLSFANRQLDGRYRELAAAFNFSTDGAITTARRAQSAGEVDSLSRDYLARVEVLGMTSEEAEAEIRYYRDHIGLIADVDALLRDERLVNFVFDARGMDRAAVDLKTLRSILTSNVMDPASFANQMPDRQMRLLAASFNFNADGSLARETLGSAQSRASLLETQENYLRQTLEIEAGMENEGVRLALYFQRNAASIKSPFDILADPALFEVVRVALGLPAEIAQANIDSQAAMIAKRLDLTEFSDPAKVDAFLKRFSAIYDLEMGIGAPSVATLFSGDAGSALGADMLMSLAQLNYRGV